jgi:hypothetical protein
MHAPNGGVKAVLVTAVVLWCCPAIAMAQIRSHGYVFGSAGGGSLYPGSPIVQIGVGGDKVWSGGFGIATEGGYLGTGKLRNDAFFWSFNLTQQFHRTSSRIIPFATGGISTIHDAGGFNFGGGILYPFRETLGLRLEFRETLVKSSCCNGSLNVSSFRVGLAFH